jgi:hypothetical protein
VVITSSIAALNLGLDTISGKPQAHPMMYCQSTLRKKSTEFDLASAPDERSSFPSVFAAYSASKQIALSKTTKFLEDTKPGFDVVHILPAVILGRNELVTSTGDFKSGTNRYVINIVLGVDAPAPMLGASAHVNDVGLLHVLALDEKITVGETGVRNFIASAGSVTWDDVNGIVREKFPKEVGEGVFKLGGKLETKSVRFDTSTTDKVFGLKWEGFEDQVKSVVSAFLVAKREGEHN